jgi:hypothetical protein
VAEAAVRTAVALAAVAVALAAEDVVLTGEGLPEAVAAAAVEAGAAARVAAAAAAIPRVCGTNSPAVASAVLANREAFKAAGRVVAVDAASRNTAVALRNAEESRHGIRAERAPSKYALNDINRTTAKRGLMSTSQVSADLVRESAQVASPSSASDDAT